MPADSPDDGAGPMPDPGTVLVLVLAAGAGRRFIAAGGTTSKVLVPLAGRSLIAHAIDAATAAEVGPVLVVVSPAVADDATFAATLQQRPTVRTVVNARADAGMGTSLVAGLAAARDADVGACVVLLADQPGVDPAVVRAVVAAWRRTGRPTRARYLDGPGHPVVLPQDLWTDLQDAGEEGARTLLAGLDVDGLPVPTLAPRDVDVPADLHDLEHGPQTVAP
jgi:molybdenum cofactor cytidylyltransferase